MIATVEEVSELADLHNFFEETGANGTYGECHNAVTWLSLQIKKAGIIDYNIYICTGAFAGNDHSWMAMEDEEGKFTIIDMTVDQFGECDVPYIGPISPGYVMRDSISLCETDQLQQFIERLGS